MSEPILPSAAPAASPDAAHVESATQRIGRQLFQLSDFHQPPSWAPEAIQEALLQRVIGHQAVKLASLRFVDVFQAIRDDRDAICDHVLEYFGEIFSETGEEGSTNTPLWLKMALGFATRLARGPAWMRSATAIGARVSIAIMARQFIGGADLKRVARTLRKLEVDGYDFSLDLLGEAVISAPEAREFLGRYHEVLDRLPGLMGPGWERDPTSGPRTNISIKLTALVDHYDPIDPEATSRNVREKLRPLLRKARATGAFVNVDMEKFDYRDLTFRIVADVLMEAEFRDWEDIGIVHQAYLRDADHCLEQWLDFLEQRGAGMTIRLVKGAYWDSEQIWANQKHWEAPVITDKAATDAMYEQCTRMLLDRAHLVRTAIASHNIRSIAHALAYAEVRGVAKNRIEVQMLSGMAAPTRRALRDLGVRVRVYTPCGELISGIAYLVRRLLENTSQDNFLMQRGTRLRTAEELLAAPRPAGSRAGGEAATAATAASAGAGPVAHAGAAA
jgi:RHH-type proline utilization regulon transcriptional repressor/proline dehydrogenase/delta 1-pyrroline-5-carboxylate dehydrogenase